MGWVTDGQLERARGIPALDYVLRHEPDEYRRVGKGYRLKKDGALAVDEKGWYCHKKCTGSRTALDYLVEIRGYGLVDAVCALLGEQPQGRPNNARPAAPTKKATPHIGPPPIAGGTGMPGDRPPQTQADLGQKTQSQYMPEGQPLPENRPPGRPPLALPPRNKDNGRVIAYLQSRGIDKALIMDCINRGCLYQSKYYHNAVFLGKDEHGRTRFAAMRSTTQRFMRDAEGSDKRYGFVLPPENDTQSIAVFEGPIDTLSHQTLCKQGHLPPFGGWRLSLGCASTVALEHFLSRHPEVSRCLACTDNDRAGEMAAARIAGMPGITAERLAPAHGKDWNDTLQAVKKGGQAQGKGTVPAHPSL